jgi:hypothetical protein
MNMPTFDIPQTVIEWLCSGERGLSSEFIVDYLYGFPLIEGHWRGTPHHPFDPSDLRRCLLLLADSPETATEFPRMRTASPEWVRLVDAWPALAAQLTEEIGDLRGPANWSAPLTYAAMKRVLDEPERERERRAGEPG